MQTTSTAGTMRIHTEAERSLRDKPGLMEAVFHRLFFWHKSRHTEKTLWPFLGPLQQL